MAEIKNTFTQGKMNKDLDERLLPVGQYRHAMNIQVDTSMFSASLSCPLGTNLSSRSLFIIPWKKLFLISAIY